MNSEALAALCWGKANPDVNGEWHPAVLHMLDVSAVCLEMLAGVTAPALARDLQEPGRGVQLTPEHLAFLVACHDLGKLSPGFQAKVPRLAARLAGAGLDFPDIAASDHGAVTQETLPPVLEALGADEDAAFTIAQALGAHHGTFHRDESLRCHASVGGAAWADVRTSAVRLVREALGVDELPGLNGADDRWLMAFAGFTSVCDWIGSDTTHFPYFPSVTADAAYASAARGRAKAALRHLGWLGWRFSGQPRSCAALFPEWPPNDLQVAVEAAASAVSSPPLLVIEAPTGIGKTEAALAAVEQWIGKLGLGGLYFALPTMATSNQMFGRMSEYLGRRFDDQRVNLHLAHGLRHLEEAYATLRLKSINGPSDSSGSVVADSWFASSKRTLLSPFAVGTVDQAMLAALQCRHFFVRQFGLARKVVVIDEVHAYDAFMSRILDGLLLWLRELGSPVILLSATLPAERRRSLLDIWSGRRTQSTSPAYPRIALVERAGEVVEMHIPVPAPRPIEVEQVEPERAAIARRLVDETTGGGCVAWICNTVGGAQAAFRALQDEGVNADDILLFHARFPVEDRLRLERAVLGRFSKAGERPLRAILVATQVVEQSLDIDFDLVVTELAPIDLLLQRAGRLHRHERADRPAGFEGRRMSIAMPPPDDVAPDFGPSRFVYDRHILLRTWWALRCVREIRPIEAVDGLMDAVYGEEREPPDELPEALVTTWWSTRADLDRTLERARALPAGTLVPPPDVGDGFASALQFQLREPDEAPDVHPTLLARTRDIRDSVSIICLCGDGDDVYVSQEDRTAVDLHETPDRSMVRKLLLRSVSVQHRAWVRRVRTLDAPPGWRSVSILRHSRVVAFDPTGRAEIAGALLRLDRERGLVLDEDSET